MSSKLKVLQVIPRLGYGGAEIGCYDLAHYLKEQKSSSFIATSGGELLKYIYKKIDLPIKQIDKKENFRRIIDLKNNSGWIHVSQLKKANSIIPKKDKILFSKPTNFSRPLAKIEKGRVLLVQSCNNNWCKIKTESFKGWVKIGNIWGIN